MTMTGRWTALAVVAGISLAGASASIARDVAPLPASGSHDLFNDEPEPWRAYFNAARTAEQLADPVERCLAYPDLPGTQWPAGYGAAHCHYHLGRVPTVAETDALVSAGNVDELERRVHVLLATHETEVPERESVHRFFQQLSEEPKDGLRITERWVALAPDSALAAVARGSALKGAGWAARGGKWARETSGTQMRVMSEYFDQAESQFKRAAKLQPGWVYPYVGLMDVGKADRDEVGEWGFKKANAIDPGCGEVAYRRMQALEPRWGGSWGAMEAYANQLAVHVARRPLLANQISAPYADFVSMVDEDQRRTPKVIALLESAVQTSGLEAGLHAAATAIMDPSEGEPDRRRGVAMLLQESRFQPAGTWADRAIGRYFVRRDPAWAKSVLQRAVTADPDDAFGQFNLGAASYNTGDFDEAESHYLAAANDPDYQADALGDLASMWLLDSGLEPGKAVAKAKPFVERLLKAHPKNADGLYLRIVLKAVSPKGFLDETLIREFLAVADRSDPRQERRRATMAKLLDELKKGPPSGVSVTFD
jgi:tetratricopeptide (TPR) repeat protein